MLKELSVQLWSVKDHTGKDFFAALKALSEMGYTGVEFAGYGDFTAKEMLGWLKELNLNGISAHVSLDSLTEHLDREIEYLNIIGAKYIVCPWASITTVDSAKQHADIFNRIGEKCLKNNLVFAYHNHAHELKLDNGQYPLEVLFDNVDLNYVKQQPDVYWVAYAGLDACEYIKQNAARCPIIHLKQIKDNQSKENVNAGDGIIDFEYIVNTAKGADYVYEQENFQSENGDSMESVRKSVKFLIQ